MLFAIKNIEDLEKLEELASFKNQLEKGGLQDKLGKQLFHENIKKSHEPLIDTSKDSCENLAKTVTEIYFNNKKAIEILNENF